MKRLAIVTTHPIQYNAPLFKRLQDRGKIEIMVYYTLSQSEKFINDKKFGRQITWDIPLLDGYNYEFIKNISVPDSNRFWGVINMGLFRKLSTHKYDAVLIYGWHHWSHFLLMQLISSKQKLYFRGDSIFLNKSKGIRDYLKKLILRFVYRNVDKAFYVGIHNKAYMLQYGIKFSDLVYAPHVVDNERFAFNHEESHTNSRAARTALGFKSDDIVFIYTGKFYSVKRIDLLIEAFKSLPMNYIKLLLVGNGEDEHKLKKLSKDDQRIVFEPFKNQSEMPWVYRMGDVFVLPSESETWGLSVNEAMACGLPVIVSSACGCAPELIINGDTGYIFKVNDEEDLKNKILIMSDKSIINKMSQFAIKHIKKYNLDELAESIEKTMQEEKMS